MSNPNLLKTGYENGLAADIAPDAFEMSSYAERYTLGFIAGFRESQSIQMANPDVAVWTAAEMAYRYHVPVSALLQQLGFDGRQHQGFHEATTNEREE